MKPFAPPCLAAAALLLLTSCQEVTVGSVMQDFGLTAPQPPLDDGTITRGLKEALAVGTQRAVQTVSQQDGYFGNQLIKVLMPEKMRNVADLLKEKSWTDWSPFTYPFNLTQQPAASIPCALSASGLPIGLQPHSGVRLTGHHAEILR